MKHQHQYQMASGGGAVCTVPGCRVVLATSGPMVRGAPKVCAARALHGSCVLPVGHNRGQLDIPSNHRSGREVPQSPTLADDWADLTLAWVQFRRALFSRLKRS